MEFAIVVPLLLLLILSMVDVGRLLIVTQTLNGASYQGSRVAAKSVTRYISNVQQGVWAAFPLPVAQLSDPGDCSGIIGDCLTVNPLNSPACASVGTSGTSVVSVTASVTFTFFTPVGLLWFWDGTNWGDPVDLTATSQAVCLD